MNRYCRIINSSIDPDVEYFEVGGVTMKWNKGSMSPESPSFDREHLRRWKNRTPEQRLDWLEQAQEFVAEIRRNRAKNQKIKPKK